MQQISEHVRTLTTQELATECAFLSDRLSSLLTAIQLRAEMMLDGLDDEWARGGLKEILEVSEHAAKFSVRLHELSTASLLQSN
jgi:hypothetical protein